MMDIVPGTLLAEVSASGAGSISPQSAAPQQEQQFSSNDGGLDAGGFLEPQKPKSRKKIVIFVVLSVIAITAIVVAILFVINFSNVQKLVTPEEVQTSQAYQNEDEDGDGLTTLEEITNGTQVSEADTDGDGMTDGFEVDFGLNPLDSLDAAADEDEDGLNNADEFFYETLVHDPDTDKDGYKDGAEVAAGFNPNGSGQLQKRLTKEDFEGVTANSAVVSIGSSGFDPNFIRVTVGENVTFINNDSASHSITGPEIETGNILPGKSYTLDFSELGTYEFYDLEDENFKGKIVVLEKTENGNSTTPETPQENTENQ